MSEKSLWGILVPKYSNKGIEFTLEQHQAWDEKIRELGQGLTIFKSAKGQWMKFGVIHQEEMIPVGIYCTRENIDTIVDFTMDHYNQKAVMAGKICSEIILRER